MWLLLAALLEFGRMLAVGQMLQNAARAAARSLALAETFGAEASLEDALASGWGRARVFDPEWLVLDFAALDACGALDRQTFEEFVAGLPLVNRMLVPAMIRESVSDAAGVERQLLRYPGALLRRLDASADPCVSAWTVGIPQLESEGRIRWLPVLEEAEGGEGFALSAGGVVSLRIHYPYAAIAWSASRDGGFGGLIDADDAVVPVNPSEAGPGGGLRGALLPDRDEEVGPYAGSYGLGRQFVLPVVRPSGVRPYTRILVGEAAFPREVVAPWPP